MPRYAVEVSYDGGAFGGWQTQPGQLTVQESLESALSLLNSSKVNVVGAGRTDAGVHARAQICSFDMAKEWDERRIVLAINSNLPTGVSVMRARRVEESFHARFDAKSRTYKYFIWNACAIYPQMLGKVCWLKPGHKYDWEKAKAAFPLMEGKHDFSCFCRSIDRPGNSVRTIYIAQMRKHGNLITLTVKGNGFLTNMVRIMTGCMEKVAKGEIGLEKVKALLNGCAGRGECGRTFPSEGLYLWKVDYEPRLW